jgi:Ca2+/Na+ antiporter
MVKIEKVDLYFYLMVFGFSAMIFLLTTNLTFIIKCVVLIFLIIFQGFIVYRYLQYKRKKTFDDMNVEWPPKQYIDANGNKCPDYWVHDFNNSSFNKTRCVNVFNIPTSDSTYCSSVNDTDYPEGNTYYQKKSRDFTSDSDKKNFITYCGPKTGEWASWTGFDKRYK